jgi:polyhydroxyalkanoate synthesis regulator phasin
MSLKSIIDSAKHLAFEEQSEEKVSATKAQPPTTSAIPPTAFASQYPPNGGTYMPVNGGTYMPVAYGPVLAPGLMPPPDDTVYQTILSETDFDATEIGALLKKFLEPLANIPMDERTRFQAALAQAKQHTNLTPQAVLSTIDSLKTALQNSQQKFNAVADDMTANDVTARRASISEKQNQVDALQREVAQLSSELVTAQGNIQRAQQNFANALNRRTIEIEQLKAKYTALLG